MYLAPRKTCAERFGAFVDCKFNRASDSMNRVLGGADLTILLANWGPY